MSARPGTVAFVRDVAGWSIRLAVAVVALAALVTRGFRFPLAFTIGAAVDIGTILLVLRKAPTDENGFAGVSRTASVLVAGRLGLKAILLGAAAMLPRVLDLWGMAAGVLIFDGTLMTAGSLSAVMDVRHWRTH